jgi:hypothetical protein
MGSGVGLEGIHEDIIKGSAMAMGGKGGDEKGVKGVSQEPEEEETVKKTHVGGQRWPSRLGAESEAAVPSESKKRGAKHAEEAGESGRKSLDASAAQSKNWEGGEEEDVTGPGLDIETPLGEFTELHPRYLCPTQDVASTIEAHASATGTGMDDQDHDTVATETLALTSTLSISTPTSLPTAPSINTSDPSPVDFDLNASYFTPTSHSEFEHVGSAEQSMVSSAEEGSGSGTSSEAEYYLAPPPASSRSMADSGAMGLHSAAGVGDDVGVEEGGGDNYQNQGDNGGGDQSDDNRNDRRDHEKEVGSEVFKDAKELRDIGEEMEEEGYVKVEPDDHAPLAMVGGASGAEELAQENKDDVEEQKEKEFINPPLFLAHEPEGVSSESSSRKDDQQHNHLPPQRSYSAPAAFTSFAYPSSSSHSPDALHSPLALLPNILSRSASPGNITTVSQRPLVLEGLNLIPISDSPTPTPHSSPESSPAVPVTSIAPRIVQSKSQPSQKVTFAPSPILSHTSSPTTKPSSTANNSITGGDIRLTSPHIAPQQRYETARKYGHPLRVPMVMPQATHIKKHVSDRGGEGDVGGGGIVPRVTTTSYNPPASSGVSISSQWVPPSSSSLISTTSNIIYSDRDETKLEGTEKKNVDAGKDSSLGDGSSLISPIPTDARTGAWLAPSELLSSGTTDYDKRSAHLGYIMRSGAPVGERIVGPVPLPPTPPLSMRKIRNVRREREEELQRSKVHKEKEKMEEGGIVGEVGEESEEEKEKREEEKREGEKVERAVWGTNEEVERSHEESFERGYNKEEGTEPVGVVCEGEGDSKELKHVEEGHGKESERDLDRERRVSWEWEHLGGPALHEDIEVMMSPMQNDEEEKEKVTSCEFEGQHVQEASPFPVGESGTGESGRGTLMGGERAGSESPLPTTRSPSRLKADSDSAQQQVPQDEQVRHEEFVKSLSKLLFLIGREWSIESLSPFGKHRRIKKKAFCEGSRYACEFRVLSALISCSHELNVKRKEVTRITFSHRLFVFALRVVSLFPLFV